MNEEPQSQMKFWVCPNCGQGHFGDAPPDMCDFCRDFTTWRLVKPFNEPETDGKPEPREYRQLPLFPDEDK